MRLTPLIIVATLACVCTGFRRGLSNEKNRPQQLSQREQRKYDEMVNTEMEKALLLQKSRRINRDDIVFTLYSNKTGPNGVRIHPGQESRTFSLNNLLSSLWNPPLIVVPSYVYNSIVNAYGVASMLNDLAEFYFGQNINDFITVDWSAFVPDQTMNIFEVITYAMLVAIELAVLIREIQAALASNAEKIQMVGHSMGAQILGLAAARVAQPIGRITGLDPAGPYFDRSDRDKSEYLDATDADFVEIYHTNAGNVKQGATGFQAAVGHVDYYPNGGFKQPGCKRTVIKSLLTSFTRLVNGRSYTANTFCNTYRSTEIFLEALRHKNDTFRARAFKCAEGQGYEYFLNGDCLSNKDNTIGDAGAAIGPGTFYFLTAKQSPYLLEHHRITVVLEKPTSGQIFFYGRTKTTSYFAPIVDKGIESDHTVISDLMTTPLGEDLTDMKTSIYFMPRLFSTQQSVEVKEVSVSTIFTTLKITYKVAKCMNWVLEKFNVFTLILGNSPCTFFIVIDD